ncbi:hypothetical protein HDV00_000712 [Rhizophlyctis rosea]|nr:hypothetical protein HDV00_000712 [Rhizophlyctis rosea]
MLNGTLPVEQSLPYTLLACEIAPPSREEFISSLQKLGSWVQFRSLGREWVWEAQPEINEPGTEITFRFSENTAPFIIWDYNCRISVEASLEANMADVNHRQLKPIPLMHHNIGLKSYTDNAKLEAEDKSYTLTYSVTPTHPEQWTNLYLLTIHSFTCQTKDLCKTILHNLYKYHLTDLLRNYTWTNENTKSATEVTEAVLAHYHKSFTKANIDTREVVYCCQNCRVYGKSWESIKAHILQQHFHDISIRMEYHKGDKDYNPVEFLVKWKVKKDKTSVYALPT